MLSCCNTQASLAGCARSSARASAPHALLLLLLLLLMMMMMMMLAVC
jgi:hypothetical protein